MFNTASILNEVPEISTKIQKGYKTLASIESVEVAVTPKELVWQQDKVKLYHYHRDTPAKCKIPVLVSFAIMNRHDVLDLQPDRSLMKKLLEEAGNDVDAQKQVQTQLEKTQDVIRAVEKYVDSVNGSSPDQVDNYTKLTDALTAFEENVLALSDKEIVLLVGYRVYFVSGNCGYYRRNGTHHSYFFSCFSSIYRNDAFWRWFGHLIHIRCGTCYGNGRCLSSSKRVF